MTGPTNSPSHPTTNARPLWHRDSTPTTTAAAKRGYRRSSAPTSMVGAGLIGLSWCSQLRSASRVRRTLVSGPTPGSSRSTATCATDCSTAGLRGFPRSQSAHRGLENRLRYRTAPQHPRRPHPQQPGPGLDRRKPTSVRVAAGPSNGARAVADGTDDLVDVCVMVVCQVVPTSPRRLQLDPPQRVTVKISDQEVTVPAGDQ